MLTADLRSVYAGAKGLKLMLQQVSVKGMTVVDVKSSCIVIQASLLLNVRVCACVQPTACVVHVYIQVTVCMNRGD